MAIPAVVNSEQLAALPEPVQAEFQPLEGADGQFVLDVGTVDGYALENVVGLRNTVEATRAERDAARKDLKSWTDAGFTVEEAKRAIANSQKFAGADDKSKAAVEAARQETAAKYQKDLDAAGETLTVRDNEVAELLIDQQATQLLSQLDEKSGKPIGNPTLLIPHIKQQVKVVRGEDGKARVQVFNPETGHERVSMRKGQTGAMTLDELVLDVMREDDRFAPAYSGSGASGTGGAGGAGGNGAGGASNPWLPASFNLTEQMRISKDNPQRAELMRREAGAGD